MFDQPLHINLVFFLSIVGIVIHVKLRRQLMSIEDWKEAWEETPKWLQLGSGATTFDYRIQVAVLTGALLSSPSEHIRQLARIYGIILYIVLIIMAYTFYDVSLKP